MRSRPHTAPWKRHFYFKQTRYSVARLRKEANRKDTTKWVTSENTGLLMHPTLYDLKGVGGGGLVVAAGSVRKDGEVYTVINEDVYKRQVLASCETHILGKRDQMGTGTGSYRYSRVGELGPWKEVTAGWWVEFLFTCNSRLRLSIYSPVATQTWPQTCPLLSLTSTSYWYRPCLLIQRECAHTGHQKRGSVLIGKGRRRGRPRGVSAAEPPRPPSLLGGTMSAAAQAEVVIEVTTAHPTPHEIVATALEEPAIKGACLLYTSRCV